MPWIKVYSLEEATGFLKKQYEAAIKRAGRIWHIVSIMSQNPRVMKSSLDFYGAVMYRPFTFKSRTAGDAGSGGIGRKPLYLLNSRPRLRPPG